jgi:hypothetical protein
MAVQANGVAWRHVDQDEGDFGSVVLAYELVRAGEVLELSIVDDGEISHGSGP